MAAGHLSSAYLDCESNSAIMYLKELPPSGEWEDNTVQGDDEEQTIYLTSRTD